MAITLYDREEDGGSCLSMDGAYILRQAVTVVRSLMVEAEEDGPVDLRDLQVVLTSAVEDVILHEIVTRRLS